MTTTENCVSPALHTTGSFSFLAQFNHGLRMNAVISILRRNEINSIFDVGCGQGDFIQRCIRDGIGGPFHGIDNWQERLELAEEFFRDQPEGRVNFSRGSMTEIPNLDVDPERYRSSGAAVLLETIEHVPFEEVDRVVDGVFDFVRPKLVVITTPDATKKLSPEKMEARGHYFEWNPEEFESWANDVASRCGYDVKIEQLSGPTIMRNTQISTFQRVRND